MRRPPLTLAAVAAAVVGLAACGGTDDGASGCTPGPSLTVHAQDALTFDAEAYDTAPGCVGFTYVNDGSIAHTLLIKGVKGFKLAVGSTDTGAVSLEPGTYTLFCDVSGHEVAGMVADLTVG
jgi:uncharacterized cupredoxin-like copper-binding protein